MSLPRSIELAACGLDAPADGELLAIMFKRAECDGCVRLPDRLSRIAEAVPLDVVEIDAADNRAAAEANNVDAVPVLYLVTSSGDVLRSWIGEPLAGTLEHCVLDYFDA